MIEFEPVKGWKIKKSKSFWIVTKHGEKFCVLTTNGHWWNGKKMHPPNIALQLKQFVVAYNKLTK